MNYPGQQQGYGRPRRKPNFVLLLMLGAMAFFLYTQYQNSRQQAAAPESAGGGFEIPIPDISNDGPRRDGDLEPPFDRNPHSNPSQSPNPYDRNSDWSLDTSTPSRQVADQQESVTVQQTNQGQEVVRSGDWEMEEGASTPNANGSNTLRPSAPKKTREGDWSLEEVKKK